MRINAYYYGTAIPLNNFLEAVGINHKSELETLINESKQNSYSWGGYRADKVDENEK